MNFNKYHDRTGIYTNPALDGSSAFKYNFKNAYDKLAALEDLEELGAGYDLREIAAKANFSDIMTKVLSKLNQNNNIDIHIAYSHIYNDAPADCARIQLQCFDGGYCRLQGLNGFDSTNGFWVDIWPVMLTAPLTELYDAPGYEKLPIEDRKVLRIAKTIYKAWEKWQYDRAYNIISGVGTAKDLDGLRQDIVDKARKDEYVNNFFADHYAQVDTEYTKKLYEEFAGSAFAQPINNLDKINKDLAQTVEDLYNDRPSLKDLYKSYCCSDNNDILETCLGGKDDE